MMYSRPSQHINTWPLCFLKLSLWVMVLLLFNSSGLYSQNSNISYYLPDSANKTAHQLLASYGDSTYQLIEKSNSCFTIADVRDFNQDSLNDVLVEVKDSCGNNCCGSSYFFFTFSKGRFIKTRTIGFVWGNPAEFKKWENQWSVVLLTSPNNPKTIENNVSVEQFILKGDSLVVVYQYLPHKVEAIVEIDANQFDINNIDKIKNIVFDLDGDHKKDTIRALLLDNSKLSWQIAFADGKATKKGDDIKRIGVLQTKMNGLHDLVVDMDIILQWDGQIYKKTLSKSPNKDSILASKKDPVIAPQNEVGTAGYFFFYKIKKKGESLSTIAYKYKTSVKAIKSLNGKISNVVKIGERLKIPKKETNAFYIHVILYDETLWSISQKYKVPVEKIKAANELTDNNIKFGKVLKIPKT